MNSWFEVISDELTIMCNGTTIAPNGNVLINHIERTLRSGPYTHKAKMALNIARAKVDKEVHHFMLTEKIVSDQFGVIAKDQSYVQDVLDNDSNQECVDTDPIPGAPYQDTLEFLEIEDNDNKVKGPKVIGKINLFKVSDKTQKEIDDLQLPLRRIEVKGIDF